MTRDENDTCNNGVERSIWELLDSPKPREELESSLDYPATEVRSALREMLYTGQLETTPEWKYERSTEPDIE